MRRGAAKEKLLGKFLREVMPFGNAQPLKTIFFYVLSRRPGQSTDASAMRSARGGQAPTFGAAAPCAAGAAGGRAHRTRLQRAAAAAREKRRKGPKMSKNGREMSKMARKLAKTDVFWRFGVELAG